MSQAAAIDAALAERRALVEDALAAAVPREGEWPAAIHRAMRYSLFAGGKRLRPLLVLAAAEAVGGDHRDALPYACAVELIHTYSLVHDDLPAMDDDDLRRGQPTLHRVHGEALAILAGDALLTRAFRLLGELPAAADAAHVRRRLDATALLAEACGTGGLIGGQVEDLASEGARVDGAALERIHRAKTGALLEACVRGGGLLAGGAPEQLAALGAFGRAIGLAFQVVDDVLDATEPTRRLGKTAGKDSAAGKATYVRLLGVDGARARATELLAEATAALAPFGGRGEALVALARAIVERRR